MLNYISLDQPTTRHDFDPKLGFTFGAMDTVGLISQSKHTSHRPILLELGPIVEWQRNGNNKVQFQDGPIAKCRKMKFLFERASKMLTLCLARDNLKENVMEK